jgi:hypothetical protein
MSRADGYFVSSAEAGRPFEADSLQCPHCGGHFMVKSRATPAELGQFCTACMKQCCTKPACNDGCRHFMKQIEAQEARGRLLATLGL